MPDVQELGVRAQAEFLGLRQRASQDRSERAQEHQDRQRRLERLEAIFGQLRQVWKPCLEALAAPRFLSPWESDAWPPRST
jgi:hypothetical protein